MEDQERSLRLLNVVDRAPLQESLPVVPRPTECVDQIFLVRDVSCAPSLEILSEIPTNMTPAANRSEVTSGAPGRRVTAVGTTGHADLRSIDEAGIDEVVDRVDQVVELLARRVALAQLREGHASASAPPIIGQEDRNSPWQPEPGRAASSQSPSRSGHATRDRRGHPGPRGARLPASTPSGLTRTP